MNFSPRITVPLLGLSGLFYVNPPSFWLSRPSFEDWMSNTGETLAQLSEMCNKFLASF